MAVCPECRRALSIMEWGFKRMVVVAQPGKVDNVRQVRLSKFRMEGFEVSMEMVINGKTPVVSSFDKRAFNSIMGSKPVFERKRPTQDYTPDDSGDSSDSVDGSPV